ncbi:TRAP transporter large permease [Succinatimonas hippei]|uniref:TRAP transporter large permease n=1 Tax=Succinatimonas hippei TaxID=626938 RepID=UPI0025A38F6E|nr:TRAP transporter large permease [Succinatimonas hippei]MDM8120236.1 TRAP transporter large permease [Succinatimonas hippei]
MIMFAMFVGVLVTLFIGVTTAGSMAFISIATYIGMGDATLNNMIRLPSSMYDQVKGITLMAIPFFLLMGNFMNRGGVSKDLFAFARACLGHRWGGLANAAIASCMIMSAMSGSAAAVAAGVGMIAIAEMRNTGYHQPFSCAAIAAGGGLGPIIPPSITLILFASLVPGTSVNALFLGGAIPGILTGLFFIIYASYESRHSNFGKVPAVPMKERVQLGIKAIWALLIPVIVLGGIFIGLFTATEAAAVAAFYSMLLGMFKYRQLKLADLPGIFWATAKSTGQIMFVIATAAFFQHVLLKTRIPHMVVEQMVSTFSSIAPILVMIILLLLLMGCFMEGTAILLITVPIFYPLAQAYDYPTVQLAIVMCIALACGVLTPPVGLNLYVMSSITGEKMMKIGKAAVPFVIIMVIVTLMVAFFEPLTTFLPHALGYNA